MAPGKPPALSSVAKNIATSLSSPVSVLWAHQLRREHSALLTRIDDLASAVSNVSSAQLKKIAAQATRAETKVTNVESEQTKLKKELDRATERDGRLEEDVSRVSARLEISEGSILVLHKDFRTVEEQLQRGLIDRLATVEQKLEQDWEKQERQVQELEMQFRKIQNRLPDIITEGVIGVRDSMEEFREQMNQTPERGLRPATRVINIDPLHASGLAQPDIELTEDMLTRRPNFNVQAELYPPGDIDLDENMLTPEPDADEVGQTLPGKTMAMLPETPTTKSDEDKDSTLLKQGKFQSWDQYLTAAEAFMVKFLKRKEVAFIEAFVDGIYDERLRRECEMMLNESGWSWESVKEFVTKFATAEMETEAKQRTGSLTHKHRKGEICPVCSQNVNVPQSGNIANEIANIPARGPLQLSAQRPQTADPRRRSQRIHQQGQASPVRADHVVKPKASKGATVKPVDKSRVVTPSISAQIPGSEEARANVKINKEKPATTGLEAVISTGVWEKLRTPRAGAQEKDLDGVKQDRRISEETWTTPEAPRKKKRAPIQKTHTPPPADFQPISTMNHKGHCNSPALPNNVANTTTSVRDVSQKEGSKKRKLVEQLEVPDPTRPDLAAPFDGEIKQSEAREPERKRRKKRTAAPIPMIPILPISDDE